jgi:phosphatidylserine decarboxylase
VSQRTLGERAFIGLQYLLPQHALSWLVGRIAESRIGLLRAALIRAFLAHYPVDMAEAAETDPARYLSFNDFFTRRLRPGARAHDADPQAALCPADGIVSQAGRIAGGTLLQAKGIDYSATALLGGDAALAAQFAHGSFATLYLSPKDYHRIHMPCDGRLLRMIYVPGDLFSVNPTTARGVPGLFARNERVVCVFDTARGPFVLVLVGATIVGSMATVWHGVVNPPRGGSVREWTYADRSIELRKGEEMGRFLLGSTVVMLFPPPALDFNPAWSPARPVRLGEAMANYPLR